MLWFYSTLRDTPRIGVHNWAAPMLMLAVYVLATTTPATLMGEPIKPVVLAVGVYVFTVVLRNLLCTPIEANSQTPLDRLLIDVIALGLPLATFWFVLLASPAFAMGVLAVMHLVSGALALAAARLLPDVLGRLPIWGIGDARDPRRVAEIAAGTALANAYVMACLCALDSQTAFVFFAALGTPLIHKLRNCAILMFIWSERTS